MATGGKVIINVIVRDQANDQLVTVRRIGWNRYQVPAGHDARAISLAIADEDHSRYSYVGAEILPQ